MRRLLLLLTLLALGLGACGESDDGGDAEQAAPSTEEAEKPAEPKPPPCQKAGKALTSAVRSSLNIAGGGGIKRLNVVKLSDPPEAPLAGFKPGVYAVAGEFTGPGIDGTIGIWAASTEMVKTGGGLMIGADSVTRELNELGAAASGDSPAAQYAGEVADSDEGERARECAEG